MSEEVSSSPVIIAVDPGGSTGIAVRLADGNFLTVTINQREDLYEYIRPPAEVCVYETFQAQLISGHGLHTVRLVGAIEALCWREGIKPIPQMPQQRKAFVAKATALLHSQKVYKYTNHEVDALAHLLAYEARSSD